MCRRKERKKKERKRRRRDDKTDSTLNPIQPKKSLLQKMKAVAKRIPGTETNKRAKRNKNIVTGVGRKPTYRDKD